MAVREIRTCDLDPKHEDAKPVVYGSGGEFFTADLCDADAAKLEKSMEAFTAVGTQVELREVAKALNGNGSFPPAVVRVWANQNGHNLGDRGRIPADVVKSWRAATGH